MASSNAAHRNVDIRHREGEVCRDRADQIKSLGRLLHVGVKFVLVGVITSFQCVEKIAVGRRRAYYSTKNQRTLRVCIDGSSRSMHISSCIACVYK
jgi:hypothetical protein